MNVPNARVCMAGVIACLAALAQAEPAPSRDALAEARAHYWQHPYQPEAISRLAEQLAAAGDSDAAELLLARALLIAPDRDDIRASLDKLRGAAPLAPSANEENPPERPAAPPADAADKPAGPLPEPWPLPAKPGW